jgi:hypothetical protein
VLRRRRFRWAFERGSKINARATRAEPAQSVLIKTARAISEADHEPAFGERRDVTTSKFEARKFWRADMRSPAQERSGDARGRFGSAAVFMSSHQSQDQPKHAAAVLDSMATRNNGFGSRRADDAANFQKVYYLKGFD